MVKFTRDRTSALGGGAISTRVILEQLPQLQELQQQFHGSDRRWSNLLTRQPEIDFQPYLQDIATTYKQWWQLYTLTDVEGEQRQAEQALPTFDFGLMVQTVIKEERKQQQKVERFSVLEGIRKYADQHVLVVGRPGSGKSTALARLMLEEATTPLAKIPILVELRYWQGSIDQLILNSLTRHRLLVAPEQLEAVLTRSLLLLDGVNELPSEEARVQLAAFRRNHPQLPMVFTTRDLTLGGDLEIERKLEMQPLTETQMQEFIRAYVPEQAEAMLRQLRDRLREFGQTPLLLWMLCQLFQQVGKIPENLGLVFRVFTQGYARNLKQDVKIESDREWWKPVLQELAWVMMQGTQPTELRVAIRWEEAVQATAQFLDRKVRYAEDFARKCLRDLQRHHLIQVVPAERGSEDLEFRHQLIQEYYAAEALLHRLPGLSDEELKQEYLNYLKWTEPLALMLALVEKEALAVRVVRLAMQEVDLMLGARLAGEVKPEFQATTVGLLDTLAPSPVLRCQCWATSHSRESIPRLLHALEDQDSEVRRRAAAALGQLGSVEAIPGLLHALEDQDSEVRRRAVEALGQLGSVEAIPRLLHALEHQNSFVRRSAAYALGKLGSVEAIPRLLHALEDQDSDVRESAVEALGQLGSVEAIPRLLHALEDQDSDVRRSAAYALGKLGSVEAIPGLLHALEDQNSVVRGRAAEALGKLGSVEAIPGLLHALEDQDSVVRGRAAEALGELGSVEAIPGLLHALKDQDFFVRGRAAEALGELGSVEAIPGLLHALEHQNSNVRRSAVEALGTIGNSKTLAKLWKQRLTSPDTNLHGTISAIQNRCKYYNHDLWQATSQG